MYPEYRKPPYMVAEPDVPCLVEHFQAQGAVVHGEALQASGQRHASATLNPLRTPDKHDSLRKALFSLGSLLLAWPLAVEHRAPVAALMVATVALIASFGGEGGGVWFHGGFLQIPITRRERQRKPSG